MKILSLNIEGSLHLARFLPFIRQQDPDVVCLQEVCDYDLATIQEQTGLSYHHFSPKLFLPQTHPIMKRDGNWGVALFAKQPLQNIREKFYAHADPALAGKFMTLPHDGDARQRAMEGVMLFGDYYEKDGERYTIGTTHFTWSFVTATPLQQQHANALMRIIEAMPGVVLCGDFNVPRKQNVCYKIFTQGLIDAIPAHYTSSVDRALHKNGDKITEDLMVDYIFHTPEYSLTNVQLHTGVSDHQAITATVTCNEHPHKKAL